MKSKIVPGKDLGQPKAVTLLPDGQNRMLMGTVIGVVSKVITRTMPTGDVYEGLSGNFEAIPTDPKLPTIRSGVLYLPDGFFELIADPLKTIQQADETATLTFGLEVYAVKAGNPQGYSWEYVQLGQPAKDDPLARVRETLQLGLATWAPQITNQTNAEPAGAPSAQAPAKGGKKR
jgi:hypothetical protein